MTIQMIEQAAAAGKFRLAMTSATQSNSGASACFGFLYAIAGSPDVLTSEILAGPALQDRVRSFLATVDRSSGSSGWLKDALVANPDAHDAMFNCESTILGANQALTAAGQDPLDIIYPANGLSVADSPLACVPKGDPVKKAAFLSLQEFPLSPETQKTLSGPGRRSGLIGMDAEGADPAVWRRDRGGGPDARDCADSRAGCRGNRRGAAAVSDRTAQTFADGRGSGCVGVDGRATDGRNETGDAALAGQEGSGGEPVATVAP